MIPIALFGDESLNKESLKQHLIAAEESGVLPGLASIRFDRISQQRVLQSITDAKLDSLPNLKQAVDTLRNRLGTMPTLMDFFRLDSVDPILLATRTQSYPALLERLFRISSGLTPAELKHLEFVSNEIFTAKRPHEMIALRELLTHGAVTSKYLMRRLAEDGLENKPARAASALSTLALEGYSAVDIKRYSHPIARRNNSGAVEIEPDVATSYATSAIYRAAIDDLIATGLALVQRRYADADPFVSGRQYSRRDVTRLLCWPRSWASTLYGYRVDEATRQCAIFVTLHKADDISASTAYEDVLLDTSTMLWFTKSRRTLTSPDVRPIVDNEATLHVFVKKDDAEGVDFYYLGRAEATGAELTTMPGSDLSVVRMNLRFSAPIQSALFDYFHPTIT